MRTGTFKGIARKIPYQIPSVKGTRLKGKQLLPMGASYFLLDETHFPKGSKISHRVIFPESVVTHLKFISYP